MVRKHHEIYKFIKSLDIRGTTCFGQIHHFAWTVLSLFWNLHSLVFSCFFNDKKSTGFIEDFTGDVIARFSVRHPSLSMDPPNLCSPHLCVGACFWLCIPVRSSSSSSSSCPALSLTHNSHTQQLTHTQLPYTQLPHTHNNKSFWVIKLHVFSANSMFWSDYTHSDFYASLFVSWVVALVWWGNTFRNVQNACFKARRMETWKQWCN